MKKLLILTIFFNLSCKPLIPDMPVNSGGLAFKVDFPEVIGTKESICNKDFILLSEEKKGCKEFGDLEVSIK